MDESSITPKVDTPVTNTLETSTMDYSKKTVKELISLCKEKGIKGYSGKKKKDLVVMLSSTTTTPVSALKIEAETDRKVEPHVKTEPKMSSESAGYMITNIIQQQKEKEEKQDIWKDSPYKDLVKLQSNNVGNVGEQILNNICQKHDIDAKCDGSKTKKKGGGEGDGTIMNNTVEIKTAHLGSSSTTFQHELGEDPWKAAYMAFVNFSPKYIYLTMFKNFDEKTYKSGKKLPRVFPTKSITWRKGKGAFKLDTSVKINERSVKNGHAIKFTTDTPTEDIASFIRRIIV